MFRREEAIHHGMKSERLEDRAVHQAEKGHFARAEHLDTRSDIQRAEMVGDMMRPPVVDPYYRPPVGVVGAEIRAEERREIREAEMIAAATRPAVYPDPYAPRVVVVEPGMPGAYPPGAYPPGPGYGYPPAGGYPPGAYPRY